MTVGFIGLVLESLKNLIPKKTGFATNGKLKDSQFKTMILQIILYLFFHSLSTARVNNDWGSLQVFPSMKSV